MLGNILKISVFLRLHGTNKKAINIIVCLIQFDLSKFKTIEPIEDTPPPPPNYQIIFYKNNTGNSV